MLEVEAAQERILSAVKPLGHEIAPLAHAAGRILAGPVAAAMDLPPFDNSAMDGYAVIARDLHGAKASNPVPLRLIGRIAAGEVFPGEVLPGTCVRLFTGSPLPKGADAVVMQEDTKSESESRETVAILDAVKPWENVRLRGEDVKQGSVIVSSGERVTPGRMALLAASGCGEVSVARRPMIGLIATGSELVEPGQTLGPGQIVESNRVALAALVSQAGAKPCVSPIVKDTLEGTRLALENAFRDCDAVVTSGGVSVGEYDLVKKAFESLGGELDFWRVSIRPGKPFVFGRMGEKLLFGLPGNPVSAFVTFLILVRPALLRFQGAAQVYLPRQSGILAEALSNRGDRRHFVRVTVGRDGEVTVSGMQASHALSSLAAADGLVDVAPGQDLPAGSRVSVLRWD